MSSLDREAQLMRVVRGEADWTSFRECGLTVRREVRSDGVHWDFGGAGVEIEPSIEDLAAGVLRLGHEPQRLLEWARFILTAASWISLDRLEESPKGEAFLGALWDASFGQDQDGDLGRLAEAVLRP